MNIDIRNIGHMTIVDGDASCIVDLVRKHASEIGNCEVRFVRGRKTGTTQDCYDEFAASLQFPYYFGENWDAFDDCISDLTWINAEILFILILDSQDLLTIASEEQFQNLVSSLATASQQREIAFAGVSDVSPLIVNTVFHTLPDVRVPFEKRLMSAMGEDYVLQNENRFR